MSGELNVIRESIFQGSGLDVRQDRLTICKCFGSIPRRETITLVKKSEEGKPEQEVEMKTLPE